MRDIGSVLDRMLRHIPDTEDAVQLKSALHNMRDSVSYAAPEMTQFWWHELHAAVNTYLPEPSECSEWQTKVAEIYMGKS